jgi:DNA-binding NarL/FixJ family response regulator
VKEKNFKYLTAREIEVLVLLHKGLSNPKISQKLCISKSTAKAHVSAIFDKINAKNRIELLLMLAGDIDIPNPIIKKQISEIDWNM